MASKIRDTIGEITGRRDSGRLKEALESLGLNAPQNSLSENTREIVGQQHARSLKEISETNVLNMPHRSGDDLARTIAGQNFERSALQSAPPAPTPSRSGTLTPLQSTSDVGALVREARKRMKFSQQQLADFAGVGRRFISELESGKPTLEFNRVARVCAACGVELFGGSRSDRR